MRRFHQYVFALFVIANAPAICAPFNAAAISKCASPAPLIGQPEEGLKWYKVLLRDGVQANAEMDRLAVRFNIQPKPRIGLEAAFQVKLTPELVTQLQCVSSIRSVEYADVVTPVVPVVGPRPDPLLPDLPGSIDPTKQNVVYVRVLVGVDGSAKEAYIAKPSGHQKLDESIILESKKWKFVPATEDGKPVEAWVIVPIEYKLTE